MSEPGAPRTLFDAQGGATGVFASKVDDYAASRPDYPAALFERLRALCPPTIDTTAVDLGAGTGLLTRGLLAGGWRVVAVEPNGAMRAAADQALGHWPGYRSVEGRAEAMPLPAASAALITAAQAFHWFDVPRARDECLRVLAPQGQIVLVWNDRVLTDPLHRALDEIFAQYGGAQRGALVAHEERRELPRFFGAAPTLEWRWPHEHRLDAAGLLALAFSRSYMPARDTPAGREAAGLVHAIFGRHAENGRVAVRYTTVAHAGRPIP